MINPATLTPHRQLATWGYEATYSRDLHTWHITSTGSGWCIGTAATVEAARDWIGWQHNTLGEWPLVGPVSCPICDQDTAA